VAREAPGLVSRGVHTKSPSGVPSRYVGDATQMDAIAASAGLTLAPLEELVARTASWLRQPRDRQPGGPAAGS
jgi:hypothetical protein